MRKKNCAFKRANIQLSAPGVHTIPLTPVTHPLTGFFDSPAASYFPPTSFTCFLVVYLDSSCYPLTSCAFAVFLLTIFISGFLPQPWHRRVHEVVLLPQSSRPPCRPDAEPCMSRNAIKRYEIIHNIYICRHSTC